MEGGADALSVRGGAAAVETPEKSGVDFGLLAYFALWYMGNYYVSLFHVIQTIVQ